MTARQIELEAVEKHYGAFHALRSVSLAIPTGQFVALVGPSGCGKSTLLRAIAGLEAITSGTLRIEGRVVNRVPPRKRDLAMVFQSYALYPHLTVRRTLTYALRLKRVPRAEADAAAERVAAIIGLTPLMERCPARSRAASASMAMGRAIVREPKAILFDEPLSNLDAALRVHMRSEVRKLHDRLGATSVYVTHDQVEAMTMADHVMVLRSGAVEQQGPPMTLYDRPANRFVAGFIGSPAMNFVDGIVAEDGGVALDLTGAPRIAVAARLEPGRRVVAGLRPEHLEPCDPQAPGPFPVRVSLVGMTGAASFLVTDAEPKLTATVPGGLDAARGSALGLRIAPERVHLFDPGDGRAIDR